MNRCCKCRENRIFSFILLHFALFCFIRVYICKCLGKRDAHSIQSRRTQIIEFQLNAKQIVWLRSNSTWKKNQQNKSWVNYTAIIIFESLECLRAAGDLGEWNRKPFLYYSLRRVYFTLHHLLWRFPCVWRALTFDWYQTWINRLKVKNQLIKCDVPVFYYLRRKNRH